MASSHHVPTDRPGSHFDMLMSRLRCPGCDTDLTATGAVLIGRASPSEEDGPLLLVGRTRIVPLEGHPGMGLVEDTATLNACLHDGRYACVFCRRGIEDLGVEMVWEERRELEEGVAAAVAEIESRRLPASELLLGVLLRRADRLRHEEDGEGADFGSEEPGLAALRELAANLAVLAGVPADGPPHEGGLAEAEHPGQRCTLLWGHVPAARTPEVLGWEVVVRLTFAHPAEGHHAAFVRILRGIAIERLRTLCRRLWIEGPWENCHVEGFVADAGRLGDAGAEGAYLRLLARSLWAELLDEQREEVLASFGAG